ncbi:hypothetical protein X801_07462, partial [Opisthorchis viverrini]
GTLRPNSASCFPQKVKCTDNNEHGSYSTVAHRDEVRARETRHRGTITTTMMSLVLRKTQLMMKRIPTKSVCKLKCLETNGKNV